MDPVPWMFGSVLRASLCSHPLCRPGCVSTDRVPEVSVTAVDEEVNDGVRVTCDMNQIEIDRDRPANGIECSPTLACSPQAIPNHLKPFIDGYPAANRREKISDPQAVVSDESTLSSGIKDKLGAPSTSASTHLNPTALRRLPVFSSRAGPLGASSANVDGSDSDWVAHRQRHLPPIYHLTLSQYVYGSCLGGSAPCSLSAEPIEWARREIQCTRLK